MKVRLRCPNQRFIREQSTVNSLIINIYFVLRNTWFSLNRQLLWCIRGLPVKIANFLVVALFVSVPLARAERQLLDRVVAVVNDEAITQSELDSLLRPLYEQYRKEWKGHALLQRLHEARQKLLNQLIEDRLVFQEAKTRGIEVDPFEVDQMYAEFRKQFPNDGELEKAMRAEGLHESALKERLRRQVVVRRLHDEEIRSKVVVSPLEVENYWREHPEEFSSAEGLRVRSLTIKKSAEAEAKGLTDEPAREKIEELRRRIAAGEDFGQLAREHSEDARAAEGGLSDWIERGAMIPVIDDVIFRLKVGEISQWVETPMGYHLFRVEEKREGKQPTFEEVRDQVFSLLYRREMEKRFQEWMGELKQSAYISVR